MTLPLSPRRNDYTGTALVAAYSYNFKIFSDDDLQIVVADASGNEFTPLTKNVDYSVSGVMVAAGGTVSLINAGQAWLNTQGFLLQNYHLTILGNRSNAQGTSIRNQGTYYPATIEDTFDKITVVLQQLGEKLGRAVVFQSTSLMSGILLKFSLTNNAGKMLRVSDDQTGVALTSLTETQFTAYANQAQASASAAAASASAASGSQTAAAASMTAAAGSSSSASASAAAAAASAALAAAAAGFNSNNSFASPASIAGGGSIPFTAGFRFSKVYVAGAAGAQSAGNIQAGATDGDELLLVGTSNTNTLSVDTTGRIITNGQCILSANSSIRFSWDSGQSLWIEVSRNEI